MAAPSAVHAVFPDLVGEKLPRSFRPEKNDVAVGRVSVRCRSSLAPRGRPDQGTEFFQYLRWNRLGLR